MAETESLAPHRAAHLLPPFLCVRAAGLGEIISCLKRAIKNASTNGGEASRGCCKMPAGRVAPISGSVFYQIDRLKSGFEAKERTVVPGHCALMGATRLASGRFSAALGRIVPVSACVLLQRISGNLKFPKNGLVLDVNLEHPTQQRACKKRRFCSIRTPY